ncbi:uncharacterized protein LOC131629137 [Vicia villosa]|uniref:uncharacterized protein LOC131629137 n=1 Tax=Vicia villosa TaxID=3911 RepID=UPI00273BF38C|nr:uncharacterized protein LOC131629137 [Vicia villosa]
MIDNVWKKVMYKRNSRTKWDATVGGGRNESEVLSTFFFTDFDDKWKAKDMYEVFKKMGDIDEVYIPNKKDKRGRRYGFVRFVNVKDDRLLATKLDNVFLEGRKLFANIPRFQRKEKGGEKGVNSNIVNNRRKGGGSNMENRNQEGTRSHLSFKVEEETLKKYEKTYVGIVKEAGLAFNIKKAFHEEGIFSIMVTALGANMCVLEDLIEGEAERFIEERKVWWKVWFKEIIPWEPQDVDLERMAWIKCLGIPCHAWCNGFFETLASSLGTFIHCDDNTFTKLSMDVARLRIRTKCIAVINEIILVLINGLLFRFFVVEDVSE